MRQPLYVLNHAARYGLNSEALHLSILSEDKYKPEILSVSLCG